ncbi:M10 family metallopeptidase C-terminal domain-containing protein [Shinella sp. CPCC 101442]|uniref:calcium-binding protein n=1 Tax=Shinella sp. CPCC 101442 TaxID=2932265 RepID=UPI00215247FF|nr:calcium-binding protein [Shinella sp. CPCC 101442]MCR6498512.1 M10 family metallopeptidase C-terminal domain-containing protein [Shinella sp. CPCC 101442]
MATYTMKMPYGQFPGQYLPNHWATDYNPALGELLVSGKYIKSTSTSAVYRMDNGVDLVITGANLKYISKGGTLNGGTITSLKLVESGGGEVMQTLTGLKWAGSDFYKTVNQGDSWYTASIVLKGADVLKGSAGGDELWGFGGKDTLIGGGGGDNLAGGRGADTYDGGTSTGSIDQLTFDDAYNDPTGAKGVVVDMAKGTATDPWGFAETFKNIERIKGTQFVDKISGSAGADEFRPLGGNDVVDGRGGIDTIRYDRDYQHGGNKGVEVDLASGKATDGYGGTDTLANIENAVGTDGNDSIKGSSVANELSGRVGNDKLYGGLGKDLLKGGDGKDVFVFDTKPRAANIDTIADFNVKDDTIWLDDDVFTKAGKVGDLATAAFHAGAKAHDASDRIIYDKVSGELFYDLDGDGSAAAVQIAFLGKGLTLTASDFDIIA